MIFSKLCVICECREEKENCAWHNRFICICNSCMREIDDTKVHDMVDVPQPLSRVIPCTVYEGKISESILSYKFRGNRAYAEAYDFLAQRRLNKRWDLYGFDIVIALPLSKERMNERGYNQSHFLAETVHKVFGIPIHNEYLTKHRNTKKQSRMLSKNERIANIRGAYKASEKVKGKNILLVDDIYTTGSTIGEAAKTVKEAGANTIIAIVFAARRQKKRKSIII